MLSSYVINNRDGYALITDGECRRITPAADVGVPSPRTIL